MRRAHLGKNFIQPLEGAVQMDLDPAGGAGNILAVVFCSPALETTAGVIEPAWLSGSTYGVRTAHTTGHSH